MKKALITFLSLVVCFLLIAGCSGGEAGQPHVHEETADTDAPSDTQNETAASFFAERIQDPILSWNAYDSLIDRAFHEKDPSEYVRLIHEAEEHLLSTACIIPLYDMQSVYLAKGYVHSLGSDPLAMDHFPEISLDNNLDIVRIGIDHDPVPDPARATVPADVSMIGNCFSCLYSYGPSGSIIPACAERLEISEDGSVCTVFLKEGLKWAGGADLSPEDFVYSWKRTAASNMRYGFIFSFIEGYPDHLSMEAVSENALTFRLSHPVKDLERLLAFPLFAPTRQDIIEANPDKWYLSGVNGYNGAYSCMFSENHKSIAMIPNPNWILLGNIADACVNIELDIFENAASAYEAYRSGELDVVLSVPVDVLYSYAYQKSDEYRTFPVLGTSFLAFNARSPVFSRMTTEEAVCFRTAISLLIDRTNIVSNAAPDSRSESLSFIPREIGDGWEWEYRPENTAYAGDTNQANKTEEILHLLALAGFPMDKRSDADALPALQCLFRDNPICRETIEAFSQDLASVGIRLIPVPTDPASFHRKARSGAYDVVLDQRIAVCNDPLFMLEEWTAHAAGNYCLFGDS